MKEFPELLIVKNKKNLQKINNNRILCYLRRDVYEHVISSDENEYFDLDMFKAKYKKVEIKPIVKTIISELENLGWNCKLSFGGTGLFIYSTQKPPPSCWEDEL